jgi:hypothetical protein
LLLLLAQLLLVHKLLLQHVQHQGVNWQHRRWLLLLLLLLQLLLWLLVLQGRHSTCRCCLLHAISSGWCRHLLLGTAIASIVPRLLLLLSGCSGLRWLLARPI